MGDYTQHCIVLCVCDKNRTGKTPNGVNTCIIQIHLQIGYIVDGDSTVTHHNYSVQVIRFVCTNSAVNHLYVINVGMYMYIIVFAMSQQM